MTGKPEYPESYVLFHDDNIEIYLARHIWEGLEPGTEKLLVAVQNYGRFWLRFGDTLRFKSKATNQNGNPSEKKEKPNE